MRVLEGEPVERVRNLLNSIFDQASSASFDWSDPDRWIDERLTGELGTLARKVWEGRQSGESALSLRSLELHQPIAAVGIARRYLPDGRAWPAISLRR